MMDNILAVSCEQPVILSEEQGKKLLAEINKKQQPSKEEIERRKAEVKALFTKPAKAV